MKNVFVAGQTQGFKAVKVSDVLVSTTVIAEGIDLTANLDVIMANANDSLMDMVYAAIERGESFCFTSKYKWEKERMAAFAQLVYLGEVYAMLEQCKQQGIEIMEKWTLSREVNDFLIDEFYKAEVNKEQHIEEMTEAMVRGLRDALMANQVIENCNGFEAGMTGYFIADGAVKAMIISRLELRNQETFAIGMVDGVEQEQSLAFFYHNQVEAQHNMEKVAKFMSEQNIVVVDLQEAAQQIVNQAIEATQNQTNNTKELVNMNNQQSLHKVNTYGSSLTNVQVLEMMNAQGLFIGGTAFHKAWGEVTITGFNADASGVKAVLTAVIDDVEEEKIIMAEYLSAQPITQVSQATQQPEKVNTEAQSLNAQLLALGSPAPATVVTPQVEEPVTVDPAKEAKIQQAKATANSGAAKDILAQWARGTQAPVQQNQSQRPQVTGMGSGAGRASVGQQPTAQQQINQLTGGNNNMQTNNQQAQARQPVGTGMGNGGTTVRINMGTTHNAAGVTPSAGNFRINFEQLNVRQASDVAWYHNTEWYPAVIQGEEFHAGGCVNVELGITGMAFIDPASRMQNPGNTVAIVDVKFGAITVPFRIMITQDPTKADKVFSPNIGGKRGQNGYSRFYRTPKQVQDEQGKQVWADQLLPFGFRIQQDVFAQVMNFAHWALGL